MDCNLVNRRAGIPSVHLNGLVIRVEITEIGKAVLTVLVATLPNCFSVMYLGIIKDEYRPGPQEWGCQWHL